MTVGAAALETLVWIIVLASVLSAIGCLVTHLRDRRRGLPPATRHEIDVDQQRSRAVLPR